MSERILGHIPIISGHRLEHAEISQGRVQLKASPER